MIRKITIFALLATLLMGCGSTEHKSDKPTIFVTITPLKSIVEEVTLIGKDPHAGRDWGQEEKGTTEDEMAGWTH